MIALILALAISGPVVSQPVSTTPMSVGNSPDMCRSPAVAGAANPVVAISINIARNDLACERLRIARVMSDLGYPEAAVQVMCADKRVKTAMEAAGTPCSNVRAAGASRPN